MMKNIEKTTFLEELDKYADKVGFSKINTYPVFFRIGL